MWSMRIMPGLTKSIIKSTVQSQINYRFCSSQKDTENRPSSSSQQQINQASNEINHERDKSEQASKQQNGHKIMSKEQQQLVDSLFGSRKDLENQLTVARESYKRSKQELKQAILFEDILKNEVTILIYDTEGKPFKHQIYKYLFMLLTVFGGFYFFRYVLTQDKKFKVSLLKTKEGLAFMKLIYFACGFIVLSMSFRYLRMVKRYVEKIVYNTKTENFTFTMRKPWGTTKTKEVSRFKILYTENQFLNKRGTNYLNIETYEQYQIGYEVAWKKQDLFSHLISQRIGR